MEFEQALAVEIAVRFASDILLKLKAQRYLRTSDLARAVGVHRNTVRAYEQWGLISPVERSPSGYRRFKQVHLDCLNPGRLILGGAYPGTALRASGFTHHPGYIC